MTSPGGEFNWGILLTPSSGKGEQNDGSADCVNCMPLEAVSNTKIKLISVAALFFLFLKFADTCYSHRKWTPKVVWRRERRRTEALESCKCQGLCGGDVEHYSHNIISLVWYKFTSCYSWKGVFSACVSVSRVVLVLAVPRKFNYR